MLHKVISGKLPFSNYLTRFGLLALFIYLLLFQINASWLFTIDDMYISLRYARHWVDGYGFLWNIGSQPVEGYSNFSFVLFAALAMVAKLDPVLLLKYLGVLGLMATSVALYFLTRLWFTARWAWIPSVWSLLYCGQILWAVSGLETTVYQALLATGLFCLLRGIGYELYPLSRTCPKRSLLLAAAGLFFLAALTRPEAPVLVLLFFGLAWFDRGQKTMKSKPQIRYLECNEGPNDWNRWQKQASSRFVRDEVLAGLFFCVLFLPYLLWRWFYFGHLLPNSVSCKGFVHFARFELDWQYLTLAWPFLLLAVIALYLTKDRRTYFFLLPSIIYLILLAHAEPLVAFFNRLFLPAFVLLLPLAFYGLASLLAAVNKSQDGGEEKGGREERGIRKLSLAVSAALIALIAIPKMTLADYRYFTRNPQAGEHLRRQLVFWLQQHAAPGSQIVLADSGLIPYYLSDWYFIDSYCLNNQSMGASPSLLRYQTGCQTILAHQPDYIILTSLLEKAQLIYTPTDDCFKDKLKNKKNYALNQLFQTTAAGSSYRYEIYVRKT